jgi:hypothetical protein
MHIRLSRLSFLLVLLALLAVVPVSLAQMTSWLTAACRRSPNGCR